MAEKSYQTSKYKETFNQCDLYPVDILKNVFALNLNNILQFKRKIPSTRTEP